MKSLALLCGLIFFSLVSAEPVDTLNRLLTATQTMQADFTQGIETEKGDVLSTSAGHMALQRPGLFYWKSETPKQILIVNHGQLTFYQVDLQQITEKKLPADPSTTPVAFLLNSDKTMLDKYYVITQKTPHFFLLTPKNQSNLLVSAELVFNEEHLLHRLVLHDHLDHATLITFTHVVVNQPIDAALFTLTPPAGVDVVRD